MKSLIVLIASFFSLDMLWINLVAVKLYKKDLGDFLLKNSSGNVQANLLASLLFYMVAIFCLYMLAVRPSNTISEAATTGAIAGLFAYATYALTGQAIFQNWQWVLTISDIAWGTFLCSSTAALAVWVKLHY